MFCYFCGEEKICFLTKFCSKGFKWLFEASFVKEDIRWFCVFDSTSENKQSNRITVKKDSTQARIVLEASCVIRRCDNHYSLAPIGFQTFEDSESVVK